MNKFEQLEIKHKLGREESEGEIDTCRKREGKREWEKI